MIGFRIKEERENLKLTQQQLADLIEIAKRTLIDWEKDRTSPTAVQLSALNNVGMDVTYIVTGQRNPTLTRRESALLDNYQHLDESDKSAIDRHALALAQQIALNKTA